MLNWINAYHDRVIKRYSGREVERAAPAAAYPWEGITTADLVRVFRSESWAGTLVLSEFQRVLTKLGLDGRAIGRQLFEAFDQDGSGHLDFRECFIGLSLLLSSSQEERLECAFFMIDQNGTGRISREERWREGMPRSPRG